LEPKFSRMSAPLLAPPLLPASSLRTCRYVFCFAFGQGPNLTPGATNRALAGLVELAFRDVAGADAGTPAGTGDGPAPPRCPEILAQWEVAAGLGDRGAGLRAALSVELDGREYITSRDVLDRFVAHAPPLAQGCSVAIVAHPDHAWRCWALVTLRGYAAKVLDPRTLADFSWPGHGCDERGYDPASVQPHTVSRSVFCRYEAERQDEILKMYPFLRDRGKTMSDAVPAPSARGGSAEVLQMGGNGRCFDCDADCAADPWVSISHGTVICFNCAGVHRSFGVHISFVRSLALDVLKETEMKALRHGGNARFQKFLEESSQNVPRHVWLALSLQVRYHTPAADLYRRRLRSAAAGADELPVELRRIVPPMPLAPTKLRCQPVWTPDADAPECELCHVRFSLLGRRHHCRRCGRCVCAACSPVQGALPLPEFGYKDPCRQCKVCVPPAAQVIAGLVTGPP